jgi:hypothetical protein
MIYVSLKTATIDAIPSGTATVVAGSGKVTVTAVGYASLDTGHTIYYLDTNSATAMTVPACYDDLDTATWTKITSAVAVDVTVTATHYCAVVQLDENGRIIEFTQVAAS